MDNINSEFKPSCYRKAACTLTLHTSHILVGAYVWVDRSSCRYAMNKNSIDFTHSEIHRCWGFDKIADIFE